MIGPLLRLATSAISARSLRDAASDALVRALFAIAAFAGGIFALVCFTQAAFTLLEREIDPAGAWAVVGAFYAMAGIALYLGATRRRR